jgi:hypothetical protein
MIRTLVLLALLQQLTTFAVGFSPVTNDKYLRVVSTLQVTSLPSNNSIKEDTKNELASELLSTCAKYGQIGAKLTDEQRAVIDNLALSLAPYSDFAPAQYDKEYLRGRHELIYSASQGASSGAIGPLVGTVSQSFIDEVRYINRVELFGGLVKIELNAQRELLSDNKVRVKFVETTFYLFGMEVKRGEAKGAGVWDYIFSGHVIIAGSGEKMLLRVMKTPSTFVIVQRQQQ